MQNLDWVYGSKRQHQGKKTMTGTCENPTNRFSILQNELTDTIDDEYQHFITASKEIDKEMIPRKAKRQKIKYSDDKRIKQIKKKCSHCILVLH